jgi:hypothetical protein
MRAHEGACFNKFGPEVRSVGGHEIEKYRKDIGESERYPRISEYLVIIYFNKSIITKYTSRHM